MTSHSEVSGKGQMKALFISNSSGGMYSFRREVVEAVGKQAETWLCAPDDARAEYWQQSECHYIPFSFNRHGTNPVKELGMIRYYRKLLKEIRPDIVFTYTIKPNVYGGMACAGLHIPYIANVTGLGDSIENGGLMQKVSTTLYRLGLRKASCVFFQNETNRQFFIDRGILSGKSRRIPGSGVNLEIHCPENYPEDEEETRFLFVARIKREKGIEELLSAIREIRKERPDCIVEILGECEGDYRDRLNKAEAEGDIRYYGPQSDVHKYYKNCHCVILPSWHEGTSNVLLEGAATARPVIATRIPGCMETFEEGITGFGCEAKDAGSLAEAMRRFLKLTKAERAQMGRAGREKVARDYDRKIVIDAYLEEMTCATAKGETKQ